jgi:hypothetical protein
MCARGATINFFKRQHPSGCSKSIYSISIINIVIEIE